MNIKEQFTTPAGLKRNAMILSIVGLVTLILGVIFLLRGDDIDKTRFWTSMMHNSIYFLLICLASSFILAASSLAQGAWIVPMRRIAEAISANVWKFGIIAVIVLFAIVLSNNTYIYHWLDPEQHHHYTPLKQFFLSKPFFIIWTLIVVAAWGFFGRKFRQLSIQQDGMPRTYGMNFLTNKWAAGFLVIFGLSLASTIPWLWIMSIDSHWYSTMFSWYNFASSFVAGMALMTLFVVYVKGKGYLAYLNKEHLHDLGKFMFAFSIFWTYLWFSQFMLIWYANIPEETVYFRPRMQGPYSFFFYLSLVLNFVLPLLVMMSRPSKRNSFTVILMAILILFGHWIDFFQMIKPGPMGEHWHIGWFEIGIVLGFIGLLITFVTRTLETAPIMPKNNPLMKEAIIHIS